MTDAQPVPTAADDTIEQITADRSAHYEPFGWHHWPEYPWLSYQFRRGLGETQEGGGSVSELFLAASRMIPGDKESWHREWMALADFNRKRGDAERRPPRRQVPARHALGRGGERDGL